MAEETRKEIIPHYRGGFVYHSLVGKGMQDIIDFPYDEALKNVRMRGMEPANVRDYFEGFGVSYKALDQVWINTTSAVAYRDSSARKIKIISRSPALEDLGKDFMAPNKKFKGFNGDEWQYEIDDSEELRIDKMIIGKELTSRQAREHPIWLALHDHNQKALDAVVDRTFEVMRNCGQYETMGIFLPVPGSKNPEYKDFRGSLMKPLSVLGVNIVDESCMLASAAAIAMLRGNTIKEVSDKVRAVKVLSKIRMQQYGDPDN